jgi:hypothetical protein
VDWCREEGCYITQNLSAETVTKLYSRDMEMPRRHDPPRYDNRGTREDRLRSGSPVKVWKAVRSLPVEEGEGSNTLQESAVEGMQK